MRTADGFIAGPAGKLLKSFDPHMLIRAREARGREANQQSFVK